jgi:hypothetical protein
MNELNILPLITLKNDLFSIKRPIVFIHVPKTGGTNLQCMSKIAGKIKGFTARDLAISTSVYNRDSYVTFKSGSDGFLTKIKNNPYDFELVNRNIQFIGSHMPLPENEDLFASNVNYITLVREPIKKAISLINYLVEHKVLQPSQAEDYLLKQETDNLQTRLLAGEKYMSGECNDKTLEKAIDNIQNKFTLAAPTEEVNTVLAIIANKFAIKDWVVEKVRVAKVSAINDDSFYQKILDRNSYDVQLFNFVQDYWSKWKKENIESINYSKSNDTQYLLMNENCYNKIEVEYMNLAKINKYNADVLGEFIDI